MLLLIMGKCFKLCPHVNIKKCVSKSYVISGKNFLHVQECQFLIGVSFSEFTNLTCIQKYIPVKECRAERAKENAYLVQYLFHLCGIGIA
jgi:hypothetical protein